MHDARLAHLRVRVYYEDTDAGGIVYHATYLRWMERVRTEWLRALGARHSALAEHDGVQFVVSDLEIRYRRPARLDDLVDVDLEVLEVRRATLRVAQRSWAVPQDTAPAAGGERPAADRLGPPLTEASVRIAVMDRRSGRPAPLPRWLRDTLGTE
jgi:acyl-CoA thioester hydrolase